MAHLIKDPFPMCSACRNIVPEDTASCPFCKVLLLPLLLRAFCCLGMVESAATVLVAIPVGTETGWCKDLSITLAALGLAGLWGYYKLFRGQYPGWVAVQCLLGVRVLGVLFLGVGAAAVGDKDLPIILGVIFVLMVFWLLSWNYLYTPRVKECCSTEWRLGGSPAHMERGRIAAVAILIALCIGVTVWSRLLILSLRSPASPANSASDPAPQRPALAGPKPGPLHTVAKHASQKAPGSH